VPGLNHNFVPAETGAGQESAKLKQKAISPEVAATVAAWLKKSQP
jgi:hypothetical protein